MPGSPAARFSGGTADFGGVEFSGGVRDSGWGRTGPDSIADFTDVIWINTTQQWAVPVLTTPPVLLAGPDVTRGPTREQSGG